MSIRLRFVHGAGFESSAIILREGTAMPISPSHVECVTPDGKKYLGAHANGGFRARDPGYDAGFRDELFIDLPADDAMARSFYDAAWASIGEPYDFDAILGFAVPWHEHTKFHAICSAKMLLLLRKANWFPWPVAVPAHLVDPRDLLLMISGRIEVPLNRDLKATLY